MGARGWRRRGLLAGLMGLVALPACGGMEGARRGGFRTDRSVIPHSAARPAFDAAPGRALFLGGYAGYNYGPVGRRAALPTWGGGEQWGYPVVDGALDIGDHSR